MVQAPGENSPSPRLEACEALDSDLVVAQSSILSNLSPKKDHNSDSDQSNSDGRVRPLLTLQTQISRPNPGTGGTVLSSNLEPAPTRTGPLLRHVATNPRLRPRMQVERRGSLRFGIQTLCQSGKTQNHT